MRLKTKQTNI